MRHKNPTTRQEFRDNHQRMPDDMPRELNGPLKIDAPFEDAVRTGLMRWMAPKIAVTVDHSRVVEWRPAANGLECPYCEQDVQPAAKHECPALNRTLVVPHYACRMMRATPRKK